MTVNIILDTDSLLVDIPTEDLYEDIREIKDHLDLSNYPKEHHLYDPRNKAVLAKFKDECSGNVVQVNCKLCCQSCQILHNL